MATDELKKLLKQQKEEKKSSKNTIKKAPKKGKILQKPKKEKSKKAEKSKKENKAEKKEKTAKKTSSSSNIRNYVQDFLPIIGISNGIIQTTYGTYVKILEITPIPFFIKEEGEKEDLIEEFLKLIKAAPDSFSIKSISANMDVSEMIKNIKNSTKDVTSLSVKERIEDYIKLLKDESLSNTIFRRYFFIYSFNKPMAKPEAEVLEDIRSVEVKLKTYFGKIGCPVINHFDENQFLTELFYMCLNRNTSQFESAQDRMRRIMKDMLLINGNGRFEACANEMKLLDVISPKNIIPVDKNTIFSDGKYYSYVYIDPDDLNCHVEAGFMEIFMRCDYSVDVTLFARKKEKKNTMRTVKQTQKFVAPDRASTNQEKAEKANSVYFTTNNIRNALSGGEDLYSAAIFLTLSSNDPYDIKKKVKNILDSLENDYRVSADVLSYRTMSMFLDSLPLNHISKNVFKLAKRNFLTSSLAACFMFTTSSIFDNTGFLIGPNLTDGSLIAINNFNI